MNTPIKREDIRKGDRVRMIATTEFTAITDFEADEPDDGDTETYELIKRAMVTPTEPGIYAHAHNSLHYFLNEGGDIWCLENMDGHGGGGPYSPLGYDIADLTLLRPVAEVAAEVLAEVRGLFGQRFYVHSDIDALAAKWATK